MTEQCIENDDNVEITLENTIKHRTVNIQDYITQYNNDYSVLLILNQEIAIREAFLKLWDLYKIRICADGGANRLYDFFEDDEELRLKHLPDYIVGDLDSLSDNVKEYYSKNHVVIIRQSTQYSTDFMKCVQLISLHFNSQTFKTLLSTETNGIANNYGITELDGLLRLHKERKAQKKKETIHNINVLALGGIDGRFDQTMHSISQLYVLSKSDSYIKLSYLTPTDLIILLPSGATLLKYSQEFKNDCIGNVGLLPIGQPAQIIETRGLKWDILNWNTSIPTGKLSSSNRFAGSNGCYIHTKDDLVFNIEINLKKLSKYL
ncbi:hypothetical protein TPHA_0J02800 [Tetrapisispora phaffii CBS 4417]|uniref:Thiamine pyrophosphokinase n=1 Tax=Tetrapisispora phaffii (strain ATCC 24235 / CBS 4417 / NBRC 1672 / NRRL Y-8282 / UCD 70-5) TaxID=1071381 RepID=G8BZ09_TETPH|nr:hypothetical protein TPHA_0J02800 [Tetrapisispora phaffii CBS 4417]CCE65101.1 hypothetical protein TPHA_0J02800 [Tetrapisispora phaffii CBS 4417]